MQLIMAYNAQRIYENTANRWMESNSILDFTSEQEVPFNKYLSCRKDITAGMKYMFIHILEP